jgi:hypothetical protein
MKVTYWDYDDDAYALAMCFVDGVLYIRVNAQGLRYVLWKWYFLGYECDKLYEDSSLWPQHENEFPCEGEQVHYAEFMLAESSDPDRGKVRLRYSNYVTVDVSVTSQDARKAFRKARQLEKAPDDGNIHSVEIMKGIILELYPSR